MIPADVHSLNDRQDDPGGVILVVVDRLEGGEAVVFCGEGDDAAARSEAPTPDAPQG